MACGTGEQTIGKFTFKIIGRDGQTVIPDDYANLVRALDTIAQLEYFKNNLAASEVRSDFESDINIVIDYGNLGGANIFFNTIGTDTATIIVNPEVLKKLQLHGEGGETLGANYLEALANEFGDLLVAANTKIDFDGNGDGFNSLSTGTNFLSNKEISDKQSIKIENIVRALQGESRGQRALVEAKKGLSGDYNPALSDEEIRNVLIKQSLSGANPGKVVDTIGGGLTPGATPCETEGAFSYFMRAILPEIGTGSKNLADDIQDSSTKDTIKDKVGQGTDRASPLVLDLDGDGIELSAFDGQNQTFFDLNETGFAVRTGWVEPDDGLLAIDWNQNGRIDNSGELFGSATVDGFTELRDLDSNGDGIISAEDQHWDDLLVWQDINGDGVADFTWGEVQSLSYYSILSIDLSATEVSLTNEGHDITHTSTYTYDTGSGTATRDIVDVWFEHDKSSTRYAQDYSFDLRAAYLIGARGYGLLPDLHIAISLDNDDEDEDSLISLVTAFSALTAADIFAANEDALDLARTIMFRWAGVENIDPDSRERFVDARELAFLEAMTGQPFLQNGIYPDPAQHAGSDLTVAFQMALNHVFATLAAQTEAGELFTGDFYYNIVTDSFDGITGIDTTVLDDLETEATGLANTAAREIFWQNAIRLIENVVGIENLDGTTQTLIDAAITSSDVTLDLESIQDSLFTEVVSFPLAGTAGDDTLYGIIYQGGKDDTIYGGAAANDNWTRTNNWSIARAA